MERRYKLCNGEVVICNNLEELNNIIDYDFELISKMVQEEKKRINDLIVLIKDYVDTTLKKKFHLYEIGLVHTKLEEDIINNECFWIYIERNGVITHKAIYLKDINLCLKRNG